MFVTGHILLPLHMNMLGMPCVNLASWQPALCDYLSQLPVFKLFKYYFWSLVCVFVCLLCVFLILLCVSCLLCQVPCMSSLFSYHFLFYFASFVPCALRLVLLPVPCLLWFSSLCLIHHSPYLPLCVYIVSMSPCPFSVCLFTFLFSMLFILSKCSLSVFLS